jgi:hypothetical protein
MHWYMHPRSCLAVCSSHRKWLSLLAMRAGHGPCAWVLVWHGVCGTAQVTNIRWENITINNPRNAAIYTNVYTEDATPGSCEALYVVLSLMTKMMLSFLRC